MKKNLEDSVRMALLETGLVFPMGSDRVFGGWQFLCRQVPGQEAPWLQMVDKLLHWEEEQNTKDELFIARRYLLKDGKMVYGWFIKLSCASRKSIQVATEKFIEALKQAPQPAPAQVVRAPQAQSNGPVRGNPSQEGSIRVIRRETGEDGKLIEETEMRLPHVPKDLNVPSKPVWSETHGRYVGGGRGATFSTGGKR